MTRLALPLTLPLLDNRGAAAALAIGVLSISPAVLAQKAVAVATPQAVVPPEGEGGEKAAPTVQKPKEPRRFMMNGKLRTLKPGEVRPYVAPTLEADPAPEISQVKAVEVLEDEAQVLARPYYGAPMVGTLALGARIPVRGVLLGRGGRYCPERRWVALAPMGWICAKQARPTKEAPSTDAHQSSAIRRLSSWKAFFAFQASGTCGDNAPTRPPEDPAPQSTASITRTTASAARNSPWARPRLLK